MIRQVLVIDDDRAVREALVQTLELADCSVISAGSFIAAKDYILPDFDGIILSDIRMSGRDGFHVLNYSREVDHDLPVVLLTGEGDIPMAVSAMAQGAFSFLEKPCDPKDLMRVLERALRARATVLENRRLKALATVGDPAARLIFGHSALAETLRYEVRAAARLDTAVLVKGAPGTGIAKIAEVLHLCSARAKGAFQKRSASGLERDALQREWQACHGGSLFLDEITALSQDAQLALLDLLEVGSKTRLIAGWVTRDPLAKTQSRALNNDLFYRLEVVQVRIPSLSERTEDIPVLFQRYVSQACEQAGVAEPEMSTDFMAELMARDWPGNARALMSAAMRFALGLANPQDVGGDFGLTEQMAQIERSLLVAALRKTKGRVALTAEQLKVPRKTFYDRLARYGLKAEEFRN